MIYTHKAFDIPERYIPAEEVWVTCDQCSSKNKIAITYTNPKKLMTISLCEDCLEQGLSKIKMDK